MIDHKQKSFNDALGRLQAYEWRDRTVARLNDRLAPLGTSDKIALLKKIDELLS